MSDAAIRILAGAGGVGKTTVAAAAALAMAEAGHRTLVMTFDPSRRLQDTLGIGPAAAGVERPVAGCGGKLHASLLDARRTFDGLIERYAPDDSVRRRILGNRYYRQLAGSLAGILEYMAVEKLFEVVHAGRYDRIVLDTPPVSQALDLLEAPQRIVDFLDSGAIRLATRPWFDAEGRLKATRRLGGVGRRLEGYLDDLVGLELLRDLVEFFSAFQPLFAGFRERAEEVDLLLRRPTTRFVLVTTAAEDRVHDTLFFARKLREAGMHLASVVVNRLHPAVPDRPRPAGARRLAAAVAEREHRAVATMTRLLADAAAVETLPLRPAEPVDVAQLGRLGGLLRAAAE